ncbi:MFS transporter [Sphingomonas glacialis]|uniref:MFS transporter n=1 Tax=Sphingomonas glacialis TaxID=658225 RepID=A0A502FZ72_9SPHN|nr:MFS transporter [Sphingomonas glacialis]TPG54640.1 MFS transporter [Sphingomonas glacialis]
MSDPDTHDLSPIVTVLMAVACGAMVANLYYAQTLIEIIGPDIGLSPAAAGGIVTLIQLGYGLGLAFIVPLSDLIENKRLILIATAGAALGCIGIAMAEGPRTFLVAASIMGICSVGAQILVPLAAKLSSQARQGRTIGLVMSGLLTGIMLARPIASFVAGALGWRALFFCSAGVTALVGLALLLMLPVRRPESTLRYAALLASSFELLRRYPALRLRAAYQALLFIAFNLFWTVAPLVLTQRFGLGANGVALFALAGAGGALAAPIAGYFADKGRARATTLFALSLLTVSFVAADLVVAASALIAFAVTAVLIDAAVQLNQISGQRIIFALDSSAGGRINAAYMTIVFVFGASGSLIGSASFAAGGWSLSSLIGAAIGGVALLLYLLFDRRSTRSAEPRPAD